MRDTARSHNTYEKSENSELPERLKKFRCGVFMYAEENAVSVN